MPWLTKTEEKQWISGTFDTAYRRLGAHPNNRGTWFAVWAPNAMSVSVIGDFNDWDYDADILNLSDTGSGLRQAYVPTARPGDRYKFHVASHAGVADKTDPYARALEAPAEGGHSVAGLSSIITDVSFDWNDDDWMTKRLGPESLSGPMSVYEIHLGSWRRNSDGTSLGYREIAEPLADHVEGLGFTHVELLPVMEHPYYPSWGYQVVGYFAPTYRYGSPADFMYLVDYLHRRGIGVLLDWVPAHFAADSQSLVYFDGSHLYESDDPLMREHPDWGTLVFDYAKPGVRNFLVSNALYWLDVYHIDGLRVDAVASMLYRDYSRDEWSPNMYGGRENLEAIRVLQETNIAVYRDFPSAIMVAEESTAWPQVTAPTHSGGLGFLYKWNMGWMHDTLAYMQEDSINRSHHHDSLTFPLWYAFTEQYLLPLSHDEVVHGKGSLWNKMPGDDWQKAANLRLLYGHMFGHPGKKLLFMGSEIGQIREWSCNREIDWFLQEDPLHSGLLTWLRDLNTLYRSADSLWNDTSEGFRWTDYHNRDESVVSYVRSGGSRDLVFVLNFTPVPRDDYPVRLPRKGNWTVIMNSDLERYGGSGYHGDVTSVARSKDSEDYIAPLNLPPLAMLVLARNEPVSRKQ